MTDEDVLEFMKIAIVLLIGYIIIQALLNPLLHETSTIPYVRHCNICIPEPQLTILSFLIMGIIVQIIVLTILIIGNKQKSKGVEGR